jgi:hypothetical protein
MAANYKSPIEVVDQLFSDMKGQRGEICRNPVTDGEFVWGLDLITTQKKAAVRALRAQEWFAANGPKDAPLLPLSHNDREDYRNARGLAGIVGFYARSLSRLNYDPQHPAFDDFACGLMAMAMESGVWGLEKDENLKRRFPPRPFAGMTPGAYWAPPKEYEETMASYRRASKAA